MRSIRHAYCSPDINLADIIDIAHDNLFQQVLDDPNHVLAPLLPNRISSQYNLRPRQHDRQLIPKMSKIQYNTIQYEVFRAPNSLHESTITILLFVCCIKMYIDFIALAFTFYPSMFMMRFVIVLLNEYEWIWMNELCTNSVTSICICCGFVATDRSNGDWALMCS